MVLMTTTCCCVCCCCCSWEERGVPSHSWTTFLEAKRKELQRLNGAYKNTLKNANVELLEGFGRIVDAHTVDVSGKRYTVRAAVARAPLMAIAECTRRCVLLAD
jgi:pyruvate/2-oxoglutarate dehydrogenase complex dihydrolipoamide dehydrogenase (E3) component